jgi:hypothetical protein
MKWLIRNRLAVGLVVAALAVTSLTGTSMAGERHHRGRIVVIGAPAYIYASPAVVYAAPAPVVVYAAPAPVMVYPAPVVVYQPYPRFYFSAHRWRFGFRW